MQNLILECVIVLSSERWFVDWTQRVRSLVPGERSINTRDSYCLLLYICCQTLAHTEPTCLPLLGGFCCLKHSAVPSLFATEWIELLTSVPIKEEFQQKQKRAFWLPASLWSWNRNQSLVSAECMGLTTPPPPPPKQMASFIWKVQEEKEESIHSQTEPPKCWWQRGHLWSYPGSHSTLNQWSPNFWLGKIFWNSSPLFIFPLNAIHIPLYWHILWMVKHTKHVKRKWWK